MSGISRREFVAGAMVTAGVAAGAESGKLPTREFGRTGLKPTILALGCGNRLHMAYPDEARGVEAVSLALQLGITYLDTAQGYGDGKSETWVGKAAAGRRKELIFATKTSARTADDLMRRCEQSLKRLQTDYLDVLHIHGLRYEEHLAEVEAKGGAIEGLFKLRDQKVIRFAGITSHADPKTLATALERHDFDCTQMALNAGLQGRSPDGGGFWKKTDDLFGEAIPHKPYPGESFEDLALPVAARKRMGIIAMKVTGQDSLIGSGSGKASAEELIRYALSLPVSVVTVGMPRLEYIRANTAFARSFQPMTEAERKRFVSHVAVSKLALDRKFRDHLDA
jgi:uncharacterized protein